MNSFLTEARNLAGRYVMGICLLISVPLLMAAQNPVGVEDAKEGSRRATSSPADSAETFYQMQLMQQELRELRGMIESLKHELSEEKRLQENRYLDLDSRIQMLITGQVSQDSFIEKGDEVVDVSGKPKDSSQPSDVRSEDKYYELALTQVRERNYEGAIATFQKLLEHYPEGEFAANAYYYIGETYSVKPDPDYEKARQAYAQLVSIFPDHKKVPSALYKLGKIYHQLGDCKRAKEMLDSVIEDNPGTSVSRTADAYRRDKLDCTE